MSTWTKRYDSILGDPGYWALSSDAYRVLDHMTAWCNTQLTDGVFDTSAVAMTCSMLDDHEQKVAVDELEQAGFITADGDGFVISAYGHEQQTASEIEQKRKQGCARSKRHYAKHSVKNPREEGSNASDNALATLPDTDTDADTDSDSRLLDESGSASEDEEPSDGAKGGIEQEVQKLYQQAIDRGTPINNPTSYKKKIRENIRVQFEEQARTDAIRNAEQTAIDACQLCNADGNVAWETQEGRAPESERCTHSPADYEGLTLIEW